MLAAQRYIKEDLPEGRTPLIVPSFSSKGFPNIKRLLKISEEYIVSPILISAYDRHYELIPKKIPSFSPLIFLDSGGYEASKDTDLSDTKNNYSSKEWKKSYHEDILKNWRSRRPTVFVTYDHPALRRSTINQIKSAKKLFKKHPNVIKEILLKPEKKENFIVIDKVIDNINELSDFDIIGLTEKELGYNTLNRMISIAKLRKALNNAELETPIHIFGCLDPISTPLYFLSGADIFDGLTWLRYAFCDNHAIYKQNYGSLKMGISQDSYELLEANLIVNNVHYMTDLQINMKRFLKNQDYSCFKPYNDLFEKSYLDLMQSIGG